MSGIFTVTALAIAAPQANAVGVVRLTCLPEGLEIELLRAAGFTLGFAPATVAESVSFMVPYTAVRGLVRQGRTLSLALDPAVVTPHNRFALVRFTDDPAEALARTYRIRLLARWVRYVLPGSLGLLVAVLTPAHLAGGALGVASLGVLVAAAVAWLLREAVRWLTWGGPVSDRYRDAFEVELARHLGLSPAKVTAPWDTPPALGDHGSPGQPGALADALMQPSPYGTRRAVVGTAVALATLGLVGVMAFLKEFTGPRKEPPPSAALAVSIASAASRVAGLDFTIPDERLRCVCARADSPLWKDGVPILSALPSAQADDGSGVVMPVIRQGRRPRYRFDLAVVNNSAGPLRDVRVVLTFARRDERDQRVGITERGLFWEGTLGSGRAVKWHVRAPGTEMKIEPEVTGTLEASGLEPASPDAFFNLVSARYRVVRIHAAMMLAYLRDPRAEAALRALGVMNTGEAAMMTRIRRAAAPVIACGVERKDDVFSACVFNGTARPLAGVSVREVLASAGAGGRVFRVEGELPVHEGIRMTWPLEGGELPDEVEAVVPERR